MDIELLRWGHGPPSIGPVPGNLPLVLFRELVGLVPELNEVLVVLLVLPVHLFSRPLTSNSSRPSLHLPSVSTIMMTFPAFRSSITMSKV
ncbi:MAG TPA: hypothetical protein DCP98_08090 [Sphaerochaeta sp.]|nr:hypothetical protein [Sphaerochaeta sp.]